MSLEELEQIARIESAAMTPDPKFLDRARNMVASMSRHDTPEERVNFIASALVAARNAGISEAAELAKVAVETLRLAINEKGLGKEGAERIRALKEGAERG